MHNPPLKNLKILIFCVEWNNWTEKNNDDFNKFPFFPFQNEYWPSIYYILVQFLHKEVKHIQRENAIFNQHDPGSFFSVSLFGIL